MAHFRPFAKLNAIAAQFAGPEEVPVSRQTVRRRLAKAAFHSRLAATQFNLTDAHKAKRFPYAQETFI